MTMKTIKNIVALLLIGAGLGVAVLKNGIVINIDPKIDEVKQIEIQKPSNDVIDIVKPTSDLVSKTDDKIKIAIFNKEFAERIQKYNTDIQQVNDLYVCAGEMYFKNELVGKYPKLSSSITSLIKGVVGEENHILSTQEKKDLSEIFMGLAWSLLQSKENEPEIH